MIVTPQTQRVQTLEQVRAFVEGSEAVDFTGGDRAGVYALVRRTLVRLGYHRLGKADKGLVKRYLAKVSGLSRAQLTRLIGQHRRTGRIEDRRGGAPKRPFERRYTPADIRLLAQVDAELGQMSGAATRAVLRRQWRVFGDARFERLAELSNGHLYNLRRSRAYRNVRRTWERTRPTGVAIGERRRPDPRGRPGFLRVDTVHQGDLDGVKGVYHINVVDEVTQWQHVGTVEAISEAFLIPVLKALIEAFPFRIEGFHADNGSEYVNHTVAELLNKLHVGQFTKSRARRSNDNALVESKNASVVRKWLGHAHIPARFAPAVNAFNRDRLSPFLNHHRPCLFPTEEIDAKGRARKRYRDADVMTPYEKLKSLDGAGRHLVPGVSFEALDVVADAASDLAAAAALNRARRDLFLAIGRENSAARVPRSCGRVLRTGARPSGRVDSPWTTLARCPPPAHTRAPLAHNSAGPTTSSLIKKAAMSHACSSRAGRSR